MQVNGKIAFRHGDGGTAVTLADADEPARALLGLANEEAISGRVVEGPAGGGPPTFLSMDVKDGALVIAIEVA
jgi:hypothetical protein